MLETTPTARRPSIEASYKKKLIEVALPLRAINVAAKKEKTTTNGHPSTFHLWWGHRPFSVVRALIFATLVDDPSSRPDLYPTVDEQDRARQTLFDLIGALVEWKNTSNPTVLSSVRRAVRALGGDTSDVTIVDPFCGRGTVPLEAERLGCQVLGADLNPVAVIISKGLVEIPNRFPNTTAVNPRLAGVHALQGSAAIAADVEAYGEMLLSRVREEIGEYYPSARLDNGTEAPILAWLWARTVKCPNPICEGASTPLLKSNTLSTKSKPSLFLEPVVNLATKRVVFRVSGKEDAAFHNVLPKKGARCIFCNEPISLKFIREATSKGELGSQLLGAVVSVNGKKSFLGSVAVAGTVPDISVPDSLLDTDLGRDSRHMGPAVYGLLRHRDLYTRRQLLTLSTLSKRLAETRAQVEEHAVHAGLAIDGESLEQGGAGASAYADAIATYLGIAVSRLADRCSTLAFWQADESVGHVFVRPALPMTWDFVEPNPLADSAGSFGNCVQSVAKTVAKLPANGRASIRQSDSRELNYPDNAVIITDPPYYDNIPYADISEYFYVWLRQCLKDIWPDLTAALSTPKAVELTYDRSRHKGSAALAHNHFSQGFRDTFDLWREHANVKFPSLVFYAFRATTKDEDSDGATDSTLVSQGWESILNSLIGSGYQITGTWPIGTERRNRFRSIDSNALGSSIVLVCRPRPADALRCSRAEFIAELRRELPPALERLRHASLAATDLQQAGLGPCMAVFSKYSAVLEADDSAMTVRTALALINEELAHLLLGEIAEVDSETLFALAWFDTHGYEEAKYETAEVLLRAKNAKLDPLVQAGVLNAERGRIQLLSPSSVVVGSDESTIQHWPVWAQTMHLLAGLVGPEGSERRGADILRLIGPASADRLRDIAYHCYLVCETKRPSEARDFNALVAAWPELQRLASEHGEGRLL